MSSTSYPVRVDARLDPDVSRGLWLVKWILAIPHYLVIGFFMGGGAFAIQVDIQPWLFGGGLIGLLVFVAAVVLLFTGRYPRPVFDLVIGLQRWVLRVAGYAALMTDQYPPFRLDQGRAEPAESATAASV